MLPREFERVGQSDFTTSETGSRGVVELECQGPLLVK